MSGETLDGMEKDVESDRGIPHLTAVAGPKIVLKCIK